MIHINIVTFCSVCENALKDFCPIGCDISEFFAHLSTWTFSRLYKIFKSKHCAVNLNNIYIYLKSTWRIYIRTRACTDIQIHRMHKYFTVLIVNVKKTKKTATIHSHIVYHKNYTCNIIQHLSLNLPGWTMSNHPTTSVMRDLRFEISNRQLYRARIIFACYESFIFAWHDSYIGRTESRQNTFTILSDDVNK